MVKSMTGFATLRGASDGFTWVWEMRSVNARGLDVRLRLPDWVEGLDQPVRTAVNSAVSRGNVTVGLRLFRDDAMAGDRIDTTALSRVLRQLSEVDAAAAVAGVTLTRPSTADVLGMRGVLVSDSGETDLGPLIKALTANLPGLVEAFDEMRSTEGEQLKSVLLAQLAQIENMTAEAGTLAEARRDQMAARLRDNLARVLENTEGADETRVSQELALIAVKSDVTEELDRLSAHVKAARDLLESDGPVGRKLDFLSQEFNREANTLCSKSQATELTRVGLDLKATIDQMREQVQNVE